MSDSIQSKNYKDNARGCDHHFIFITDSHGRELRICSICAKEIPRRNGAIWTKEEDAKLLEVWETGFSVNELAIYHERGPEAISSRLFILGVISRNLVSDAARINLSIRDIM